MYGLRSMFGALALLLLFVHGAQGQSAPVHYGPPYTTIICDDSCNVVESLSPSSTIPDTSTLCNIFSGAGTVEYDPISAADCTIVFQADPPQDSNGSVYLIAVGWAPGSPCAPNCRLGVQVFGTTIYGAKNLGDRCDCDFAGNPINVGNGNKFQQETDFSINQWLRFDRSYNSDKVETTGNIGAHWHHTYDRTLFIDFLGTYIGVNRSDGGVEYFTNSNGLWVSDPDSANTLTPQYDDMGNLQYWIYFVSRTRQTEIYSANGQLLTIADQTGMTTTLSYSSADTPVNIAPYAGLLLGVADPQGRALQFTYLPDGNLSSVVDPDGNAYTYAYDGAGNLVSVTYPGGSQRVYLYNESQFVGGHGGVSIAWALTGIQDENGGRYATYTYGSDGKATSTQHSGGVELYSISGTAVTDPFGITANHSISVVNGVDLLGAISGWCSHPACTTNIQFSSNRTYDAAGRLSTTTDGAGNQTNYAFDDVHGLETSRGDAVGSAVQRTTQTDWDTSLFQPTEKRILDASSNLVAKTDWKYNSRAQVLFRCEADPAIGTATSYICGTAQNAPVGVRQWSYTYCEQSGVNAGTCPLVSLILSVDGPRTDVTDVTTYAYYQTTDLSDCATSGTRCHYFGDLQTVTNALGQATTYVSYDQNGRATRVQDANGSITDMAYFPRGWINTRTVRANADGSANANADATTTFTYDKVGKPIQVTQPDGAYFTYTYDGAHRLTDIADSANDHIHYTLDAIGNRTNESTYDPSNNLKRSLSRTYDGLNQLSQVLNSQNTAVETFQGGDASGDQTTGDGYDANHNPISSIDSNLLGTNNTYDALNRKTQVLQLSFAGTSSIYVYTHFAYDTRDNLRSVIDPDGLTTSYVYDGLNNLTSLSSPDTGTTSYTYDAAGNRATQIDARGVTKASSYDALNRLIGITYPTTSLNVSYAFDQPATGCYNIGRLTRITDSSGSTTFCYDRRGNVLTKTQALHTSALTVAYTYTLADHISSIIYPSGAIVSYGRDSVSRVLSANFKTNARGTAVPILGNVSYYPFGPRNVLTFGNGRTLTKTYDQDYAISQVASSDPNGLVIGTTVDAIGNILSASSSIGANPPTQKYQYDILYRLAQVSDGYNNVLGSYTYSDAGDRLSKSTNGQAPQPYSYNPNSHQLGSVVDMSRSYDAAGNTTQTNAPNYSNSIPPNISATYDYNGKGERVLKIVSQTGQPDLQTSFIFSEAGQLLGEYSASGMKEYAYDDVSLIGISDGSQLYYVETDQLGTPRDVIRPGAIPSSDTIAWKWDYFASNSAFGENMPSVQTITFNPRFPGQYFDAETGLNYNLNRDYEPGTGRYVESDPVGLEGGISTYGYVGANPLGFTDPLGLWVKICNRLLGGPKSPPTWKHNPFRHEYLDVSGSFFGFTSGANPHIFHLFSDGARDKGETDDSCSPYCSDDKFDNYVLEAIDEVGYPKYFGLGFFGNGDTFGINCQRWVNLVLSKAKRAYLEHEKCPTCFKR